MCGLGTKYRRMLWSQCVLDTSEDPEGLQYDPMCLLRELDVLSSFAAESQASVVDLEVLARLVGRAPQRAVTLSSRAS